MKKFDLSSWPILIVSDKINALSDEGCWLQELIKQLETQQDCSIIMSVTYSDAVDIVYSREDLGAILIDWDLQSIGRGHSKTIMRSNRFANAAEPQNKSAPPICWHLSGKEIITYLYYSWIDRGFCGRHSRCNFYTDQRYGMETYRYFTISVGTYRCGM